MDSARIRDALIVRYYEWALRKWDDELSLRSPMLRAADTVTGEKCLAFLHTLGPDSRHAAAKAIAGRFHPEARSLLGDAQGPSEKALLAEWDRFRRSWALSHGPKMRGLDLSMRRRLLPLVKDHLRALGDLKEGEAETEWAYLSRFGQWTVRTELDFGGKYGDLSYTQEVLVGRRQMLRFVSLLAWLGLSSTTEWRIATEADAIDVASRIAELATHFIGAAPSLTEGLVVES